MEWAGSDVIISSQLNDSIKEWFGDQFPVFTLEKTEPRRKESEVLQICKVLQSFLQPQKYWRVKNGGSRVTYGKM